MPQNIAKSAVERTSKRLLDEVFVSLIQKGLTPFIPGGGGHNSGDLGVDLRNLGN